MNGKHLIAAAIAGIFLCSTEELSTSSEVILSKSSEAAPNLSREIASNVFNKATLLFSKQETLEQRTADTKTNGTPSVLDNKFEDYASFFSLMMKHPPPPNSSDYPPNTSGYTLNTFGDSKSIFTHDSQPNSELTSRFDSELTSGPNSKLTSRFGFLQLQTQPYIFATRPSHSYGNPDLITTLGFAADYIYALYNTPLQVFDISRENGGRLPPHRSHNRGLDADVGIYWYREGNFGNNYKHLIKLDKKTLQINWAFIRALQDEGDIEYIFWSRRYINAMKQYVLAEHDKEEWKKYGEVLYYEPGHGDHFHVRIKRWEQDNNNYIHARYATKKRNKGTNTGYTVQL